jgi:hypothetical protein
MECDVMVEESSTCLTPAMGSEIVIVVNGCLPVEASGVTVTSVRVRPLESR